MFHRKMRPVKQKTLQFYFAKKMEFWRKEFIIMP